MTSQQFFWVSAGVAVLLAVLFLYPRRKEDPARLRLGYRRNLPQVPDPAGGLSPEAREAAREEVFQTDPVQRSKPLNVIFNYNGHAWDAFEVLGVPAGAPPPAVEKAYKESLAKTDPGSHPFLQSAYDAIRKSR